MTGPQVPLIEDQDGPLIWVGAPDSGLVVDGITVVPGDRRILRYELPAPHRPGRARDIALGILVGLVVGLGVAVAVVRAAPPRLPQSSSAATISGAPLENVRADGSGEHKTGAAELPVTHGEASPVTETGGAPLPASPTPNPEPPAAASAIATWCAPTPRYCTGWGGSAHLAAVPSFRYGDRPYRLTVCLPDQSRCTVVAVVSFCACGSADIDLSPSAFSDLGRLSAGRLRVVIEDGGRPGPGQTPPPTDVGP